MINGYISQEARQKFSIRIGIWGVVFFMGQFIIPFFFMILLFGSTFFLATTSFSSYNLEEAAPYRDGILTTRQAMNTEKNYLVYETPDSSETVMELAGEPQIAYGNGDIWCFTKSNLYHWSEEEWTTIPNDMHWAEIVDIKAIENGVIVWQQTPDGSNQYMSYFEDSWIYLPQMISEWKPSEKHVVFKDNTYLFHGHEDELYSQVNATGEWIAVGCNHKNSWHVEECNDILYVIQSGLNIPTRLWYLTEGMWQEQDADGFPEGSLSMQLLNRTNEVYMVTSSSPMSLSWHWFDGDECIQLSGGEDFPFPVEGFFALMFVPHIIQVCMPVLFAFIVTLYIRKYRVKEYITELGSVYYAAIIRRAFAEIIDALIIVLPMIIIGFGLLISGVAFCSNNQVPDESMFIPLLMFGAMSGLCCYGLGMMLIYSFLEGHFGATPGKWLLGIRVVSTDTLQPCGFGRALLRNLLRFVDGFFNYLVGILIVAFTEHQQRVGDLAARTIVIRAKKGDGIQR